MTPVHLSRDHPHQIRARSTLRWITVVRGQSRYKCQSRHKQDTESHHCNCDGIISGNLKRRETPKVANRAVWCSKWPKAECSPLQGKKATSRWSDHAAAEATSLASPILNSRKGISIYRRGATLLARKMQPDHLKELAERLYDLRDTARIIPLAQVEIGDGSASGDWSPFPRFSHDNVNIWVRRSPEYKAVRGWVVFDFSRNPTFRARFVRFAVHSVIEAPDGTLWDITQRYTSRPHPFIRHPGTDEDFDYLRASAVMHVDHYF
jgi:hypothetical protein